MKECPFCKADIEENARFCLYCMKPLVEKEVVPPAKEKRRLIWLLPVLAACLILGVLAAFLLMGDPQGDPSVADTTAPGTAITPEDPPAPDETGAPTVTTPTQETDPSVENDPTPPATEPLPCAHNYLLQTEEKPTCTEGGLRYYVCSKCEDVIVEKSPASGHQFGDATCELPKTCKVCQVTEGVALGHNYIENTCTRCGDRQNTDPEPNIRFEYHLAEAEDLGLSDYTNENNEIVITGIYGKSPTGEYIIPSYIDGKRVLAIMEEAFLGTNVKKVWLGATIEIILSGAFYDCDDLTDIYFAGEYLNMWPDALPHRPLEEKLTIHCSATCHNADMRPYKDMANLNWEEWDGEL